MFEQADSTAFLIHACAERRSFFPDVEHVEVVFLQDIVREEFHDGLKSPNAGATGLNAAGTDFPRPEVVELCRQMLTNTGLANRVVLVPRISSKVWDAVGWDFEFVSAKTET